MSRCISSHGEYGEHTLPTPEAAGLADDRFVCTRCFAFDEDAAMEALHKAEAIAEAAREYVRTRRAHLDHGPLLSARKAAHDALIAAVEAEREAQPATHPNPQP